jgi:hypothetical protein
MAGRARVPAAARIHRGDQLDARRVGDAVIGPGDDRFAGLEAAPKRAAPKKTAPKKAARPRKSKTR